MSVLCIIWIMIQEAQILLYSTYRAYKKFLVNLSHLFDSCTPSKHVDQGGITSRPKKKKKKNHSPTSPHTINFELPMGLGHELEMIKC